MVVTTEEPELPETDDEYEIVETDECDDGEWVDANSIPLPKLGPSEKLLAAVGITINNLKLKCCSTFSLRNVVFFRVRNHNGRIPTPVRDITLESISLKMNLCYEILLSHFLMSEMISLIK